MDDFDLIRTASTHEYFTVFEAYHKKLGFPVVLKQCPYVDDSRTEFFIRSALLKAQNNVYSQPLVSIFASSEPAGQVFINFIWKCGQEMDPEISQDCRSTFPSGNEGYGKFKLICRNIRRDACVDRALCLTLSQKVIRQIFRHKNLSDMNYIFQETLSLAKCKHPNVCDFLDFRLFQLESRYHCAYIVKECVEFDLESEKQKRQSQNNPFSEAELTTILQDVTAALLHAKAQGIAHRGIKPSNIFRTSHGFKIAGFDNILEKIIYGDTSSDSQLYMSPEAIRAISNLVDGTFESDVYSLGLTMLHLAALELPAKKRIMNEWHELLYSTVQDLTFSEGFKQLLLGMINVASDRRPTLESVRDEAVNLFHQTFQNPEYEALRLKELANSYLIDWNYERAEKLCAAANAIYSSTSTKNKEVALNYRNWAISLSFLKKYEEAATQFAAADAILSSFYPDDMDTAVNLTKYGCLLLELVKATEAISNYEAANAILSRLFPNEKVTAVNYIAWGNALRHLGKDTDAIRKYEVANTILSRLFPHEKETAVNYTNMGDALSRLGKDAEAIKNYEAANAIYSQHFPNDKEPAINYTNWGKSLHEIGKRAEAINKFAAAYPIFAKYFPGEKCTADNLHNLGIALKKTGNYSKAVLMYAEAGAIYSRISSNIEATAINMLTWGTAFKCMNNREKARTKFDEANALFYGNQGSNTELNCKDLSAMIIKRVRDYSNLSDNHQSDIEKKSIADSLHYWGILLKKMGKYSEAVMKYAAADIIYSHFFPDDKSTAINFHNWGNALLKIRSIQEAVEKYKSADAIFTRLSYKGVICADNLRKMADLIDLYIQPEVTFYPDYCSHLYAGVITEGSWGTSGHLLNRRRIVSIEKYEEADSIYSFFPDDKSNAINHMRWGMHLEKLGYNERAFTQLTIADIIFAHYYPNHLSHTMNLMHLTAVLQQVRKNEEAIKSLEEARAISVLDERARWVNEIDNKIVILKNRSANP